MGQHESGATVALSGGNWGGGAFGTGFTRFTKFTNDDVKAFASFMKTSTKGTLVYSTEVGRICPGCGHGASQCACSANSKVAPAGDGMVRVSRQTKGRGGKAVTVVKGLALDAAALAALGKQLRTACGAGGTVKDGVIEVQGDHCKSIMAALLKQGYKARQAGG